MSNHEVWKPFFWFCPNCGTKITAYRNAEGMMKAECPNPEAAVLLDCGCGKTVITLTAIEELLWDRFDVSRVLVVCPVRVAQVWAGEIGKWEHLKELRYSICVGSADQRRAALNSEADIYEKKIPVGLIHPASAGHGLNLQSGGSTLVWFGLTWSLELYIQTNARLWRQGQKSNTVMIQHIVAKGTIDEQIMKALSRKEVTQDALMEAVKAELG